MPSKISVNYITARDLFLSHHWTRYLPYESRHLSGLICGRVVSKENSNFTLNAVHSGALTDRLSISVSKWLTPFLKEPKAAESAPPVREVIVPGDWIGVDSEGGVILFAPCAHFGTSAMEASEIFVKQAVSWSNFLFKIREFFNARAFIEMTTPTLAVSPGTEPFLDPLSVSIQTDGHLVEKYLITSPEFNLKKSLGSGLPRVFEIAKCFRDREGGAHHRVEFHMLEWYRAFASLDEIADDTAELIKMFSPGQSLQRTTVSELFLRFTESRLEPSWTREDLVRVATRLRIRFNDNDDFNDLFHLIFLQAIEPKLVEFSGGAPLLVSSYPPSMAALARIGADGFADRFEVYWKGLEICNAFHELNDPFENQKRFESDRQMKERLGKDPIPLDEDLLKSFDLGVPPAGGIALGLERLYMALHDTSDIGSVRPFLSPRE